MASTPMTSEHKRRLQVNYVGLLENISQVDRITIGLFSKQVLTRPLKERVEGKKGSQNQLREILDILPRRPDEAFDTFYKLLVENEEDVAADLLCPELAEVRKQSKGSPAQASSIAGLSKDLAKISIGSTRKDGSGAAGDQTDGDDPDFDVLPDVWPSAELPDVKQLFQGLDSEPMAIQTKYKAKFEKAAENVKGFQVYPMCKEKRGRCLIINNIEFRNPNKNRIGSEADEKGVKKLFKNLHFDVQVEHNKNAMEMLEIMQQQRKFDHSEYQCFVCFVFTHGEEDGLHGVDDKVAPIRDFISAVDCDSLKGKPKLFFIQACQRGRSGAVSSASDGQGSDDIVIVKNDEPEPDRAEPDGAEPDADGAEPDAEGAVAPKIKGSNSKGATAKSDGPPGMMKAMTHFGADFYVTCATVPECLSYRKLPREDPCEKDFLGSWFIQAVVHVFAKYSHKRDLQNMMTKVHALVRMSRGRTSSGKFVYQVSNSQGTLEKVLYFFPGLVKA